MPYKTNKKMKWKELKAQLKHSKLIGKQQDASHCELNAFRLLYFVVLVKMKTFFLDSFLIWDYRELPAGRTFCLMLFVASTPHHQSEFLRAELRSLCPPPYIKCGPWVYWVIVSSHHIYVYNLYLSPKYWLRELRTRFIALCPRCIRHRHRCFHDVIVSSSSA